MISLIIQGTLFAKRLDEAIAMSTKQTDVFRQLCSTFPRATISKWEAMVTTWNRNPKAPNPYAEPKTGMIPATRANMHPHD